MDKLTASRRSENMRRIRSSNTSPEIRLRRIIHALGYRFRLHKRDLPGRPDIVFPSKKKVIFVHGCFWHQHSRCIDGRLPKSNQSYWISKLLRNQGRDQDNTRKLRRSGWKVLTVWECQVGDTAWLQKKLTDFLG